MAWWHDGDGTEETYWGSVTASRSHSRIPDGSCTCPPHILHESDLQLSCKCVCGEMSFRHLTKYMGAQLHNLQFGMRKGG